MSQDPIITKGLLANSGDNGMLHILHRNLKLPMPAPHRLTTPGPVPIRREIRDLEQNYPDVWSLYLLGLDAFQKLDENDPLSYYQIAGEHFPTHNFTALPLPQTE